jgi:hypothetical protein
MTPTEKTKLEALCTCIMEEQDPLKLTRLMIELNDLLERKPVLSVDDAESKRKPA